MDCGGLGQGLGSVLEGTRGICTVLEKNNDLSKYYDRLAMSRCFCCLFFDLGNSEDKSLLLQEQTSRTISNLFTRQGERPFIEEHVSKSKKIRPTSPEISVIWANNPETNAVFDKLGLPGIVVRYDKILSEWKCLKDAEKEFKQLMGIDQEKDIVQCVDFIPPEMRIGFSHGSHDSEYEFYLDIDPLVSLDKLDAPLTNQLRRALDVFTIISRQMGVIQLTGTPIVKDLECLVKLFKQDEPFVTMNGIKHSVELLNSQQVEQAYLIIKDIVSLSRARSHALMDYILQQGDQVDLQVIKDDPKNHKVIIFSKKLTGCSKKKKTTGPSNPR